jgi:hypothetical protein
MIYRIEEDYVAEDFRQLILGLITDYESDKKDYFHPCYKDACDHAEEMSVHMYGKKPEKLLNMVRPREDPEVKKYRLDAYQPTTKSTAEKGLSIVSKIFNPTLYTVAWKEQTSSGKELQSYTLEYYPVYNSLPTFLQQTALKKVLADPNGVLAVKPLRRLESDIQQPEPVAKIYGSKNVWYFDEDMFLIFIKKVTGQKGIHKYYFDYYDKDFIREIVVEKITPKQINIFEEYTFVHQCVKPPVWHLRGIPEVKDSGEIYYRSFFDPAIPFWNLAISHESDLFGAYINHLHPIRAELAEDCDYVENGKRCKGGSIKFDDGNSKSCPSCQGTGRKSVKSPYGVYLYNRDKLSTESGAGLTPVEYITVPVEPTKMLEERIEKLLEKGLYALNMDILNKIGENQSGVAKVIDRDELYDFLYRISVVMFDIHMANIYDYTNKQMFGVSNKGKNLDKNLPDISKPVRFDISSTLEIMEEMKLAKDSGANPQYIREKQKQINAKEFASSQDIKNKLDLMIDLDPCPEMDVDSITLLVDKGQLSKVDAVVHHNIESFVDRALEEKKSGFENMTKTKQLEVLRKYAEELIKDAQPSLDTDGIEGIEGDAIDTPVDVEAEAKAKLKGTVGGVQGLLQIQDSVSKGITDYEAAVVMLFEIYGFDDKTARALLGDKQKLESGTGNTGQPFGPNNQGGNGQFGGSNNPNPNQNPGGNGGNPQES